MTLSMHGKSRRPTGLVGLAGTLMALGAAFYAVAASDGDAARAQDGEHKVAICHRTNSNTNPYVQIAVDMQSVDGGDDHGDHRAEHQGPVWAPTLKGQHIEWGDIIPAFEDEEGNLFEAVNWEAGEAIHENDCVVVTEDGPVAGEAPTDTPTATPTETATNTPSATPTETATETPTPTATAIGTATETPTPTVTETATETRTPAATDAAAGESPSTSTLTETAPVTNVAGVGPSGPSSGVAGEEAVAGVRSDVLAPSAGAGRESAGPPASIGLVIAGR